MKKLRVLLLVIAVFSLITFVGCSKQELVVSQDIWLYNLGQEIESGDFSVALAGGDENISLDSSLYSFDSNFDSGKEGVYSIEIKYNDLISNIQVVVFDFDRLNLYVGQSLSDIVLPENVYFENASKIYTATGKYTEKLCFNDNGIVKETAVIVEVSQNQNEWIVYPAINNWTYGESPEVVNAQSKYGEIVYSYYTLDNMLLNDIPTQAGKYYLKAEVNGTDSYTSLTAKIPFEIEKAEVNITPLTTKITKIYDASFEYTGDILSLIEFSSTNDCLDYIKPVDIYFANNDYEKDCSVGEKLLVLEFELVNNENLTFSGKNSTIFEIKAEIIPLSANILSNPTPSQAVYSQELSTVTLTDGIVKAYLNQNSQLSYCQIEGVWSFKNPSNLLIDSGLYDIIFTPNDKNICTIETQIYLDVILNLDIDVLLDGTELSYTQQGNEISIVLPRDSSSCQIVFNELIDLDCNCLVYYDNIYQDRLTDYCDYTVNTNDLELINLITLRVKLTGEKNAYFTIYIELEKPVTMYVNGQKHSFTDAVKVGDILTFQTNNESIKVYLDSEEISGEFVVPEYYSGSMIYLEAYDDNFETYFFQFIIVE